MYASSSFQVHEIQKIQGVDKKIRISQRSHENYSLYIPIRIVSRNDEYLVSPDQEVAKDLVVEFLAFLMINDNENNEIIIGVKEEVFETLIPILKNYPYFFQKELHQERKIKEN